MKRRQFIKNTCLACAGGGLAAALLSGCKGTRYVSSALVAGRLTLAKSAFAYLKKEEVRYRSWVVVKAPQVLFPIGVFRTGADQFFASYLECTHQGCEVQPQGDYLQCPCHGSEFNKQGKVQQGPAGADLKTFPVETDTENIYIVLK